VKSGGRVLSASDPQESPTTPFRRHWHRWTEPSTRIADPGERRSARLLAALILATIPLGFISATAQLLLVPGFASTFLIILAALLVLGAAYGLCRTVHWRLAGMIASLAPIVAGGLVGLTAAADPAWFAFMGMGTVLASAFLRARQVAVIGGLAVAATGIVLLLKGPSAIAGVWAAILTFSFLLSALVVLVTRHRSAVERDRRTEILESQALYRILFEHAPIGIGVATRAGRLLAFNDAMLRPGGYSRKDLEELTDISALYGDARARTALLDRVERDGRVVASEVRVRAKDGTPYDVSLSLAPITFEGQRCILAISEDISERKRAEAEHADLADLVERSLNEVYLFDPTTLRFEYANEGARRNVGYSLEQLRTMTPVDLKPEFTLASFRTLIDPLQRGDAELLVFETVHRRADASQYPVEVHLQRARRSGRPALLALILDITSRRQAEHDRELLAIQVRTQEQRFRALIEHSTDIIGLIEADAGVRHLNPAFEAILGYRVEDWLGKNIFTLVWPDDLPAAEALFARSLAAPGEVVTGQLRARHADGPFRWLEGTVTNYADDPATRGIVFNCHDITARRQAEEVVLQNEQRLRVALDTADLAVFEMDTNLRYTWIYNPQLGYSAEQVVGRTDHELLGEDGLHVMAIKRRVLESGQRAREEVRVRAGGGEAAFDVMVEPRRSEAGAVVGLRGASLNISQMKALHAQLLHSQKMETVGRLAGGIAHDFNNLLTVIGGRAELATTQLQAKDPLSEDIEEIRSAAARAAALTQQLLAFSRKQMLRPELVDLKRTVAEVSKLLKRLIGENIALVIAPAAEMATVLADPGQIEQVIVNLAINARDAMPNGGSLTIETQHAELGETAARRLAVPPGSFVRLAVSDTGIGMDAATVERIFEPFFTTKPPGSGTGLGLSTVYGIVTQSGGGISVDSEIGKGSTFTIYLPRIEGAAHASRTTPSAAVSPGIGIVLVVEDEAPVRRLAVDVLTAAGYRVIEAASGMEALQAMQRGEGPIDLMVTDVVMPGMSGVELAGRLAKSHPGMQVLYTSGFTDDPVRGLDGGAHFIAKPYSVTELTRRVRTMLESRNAPPSAG
jgi:PAS domain S-box-containing protein